MTNLFDTISRIGVVEGFSPKKVREYQLANIYTMVAAVAMFINLLAFGYFHKYAVVITCGIGLAGLISSFLFTARQQIRGAEVIALASNGFGVIAGVTLYGQFYFSQLYLILLIVAYIVTFGNKYVRERNALIFITLLLFAGSFFMGRGAFGTEADAHAEDVISKINLFLVMVIMLFFFYASVLLNRSTFSKLQVLAREADEERKAKSEFLSIMSHEIRTPLNAILGVGHLLAQAKSKLEIDENLKILHTSTNQLLLLVNDILDYNKLEAGKIELYKHQVNLKELIHNTYLMFSHKAKAKNLDYIFDCDDKLNEFFYADGARINQVVSNLLSNAIKFSEVGVVKFGIKVIGDQNGHQLIRFEVADTGVGISPERQEKLFKVFTQAGAEVSAQFGGTGLGLAISQKILELMSSKIKIESEANLGSKFSFVLNLEKIEIQQESISDGTEFTEDCLKGLKILMAEDNIVNQKIMSKFSEKWSLDLTVVNNGKEAIEALEKNTFDIVLMDVQMPEMDGIEATMHIRSSDGNQSEIPIIALTADVTNETREKVDKAGFNAYITKPFIPKKLMQTICEFKIAREPNQVS